MGKVLVVDLTLGKLTEEKIPDNIYRDYLSGMGLGAYMIYRHIPAVADPLGPDNMLGFVSGLLTGTGSLFTGRWMAVGKSPLTGGFGDANCGGNFSPAIKKCGYDGIFFKGMSDRPVFLYIDDNVRELRDASDLWGTDAVETEEVLINRHKGKPRVACIGPAGEKVSLISGICNDRGRIAARSGLGAVMGAKKLKAVVLNGKERIDVHDRESVKSLSAKCNKFIQMNPPLPLSESLLLKIGKLIRKLPFQMAMDGFVFKVALQKWGTVFQNQFAIESGDSPIRNWKGDSKDFGPEKSRAIRPDIFTESEIKKYSCYSCPLGCGGICKTSGKYSETHKPEYETVLSLSGLCDNNDVESIFYLNEMLNRAGMDTISAGASIAFAMECFEMGVLTGKDTEGLDLTWGNTEAVITLLEKMVKREGLGDLLADGTKVAAEKIGNNSHFYAMHAGGQEMPMHDPRMDPGYALHYSVEPSPGKHTVGSQAVYELYQLWKVVSGLPKPNLLPNGPATKTRSDPQLHFPADAQADRVCQKRDRV